MFADGSQAAILGFLCAPAEQNLRREGDTRTRALVSGFLLGALAPPAHAAEEQTLILAREANVRASVDAMCRLGMDMIPLAAATESTRGPCRCSRPIRPGKDDSISKG